MKKFNWSRFFTLFGCFGDRKKSQQEESVLSEQELYLNCLKVGTKKYDAKEMVRLCMLKFNNQGNIALFNGKTVINGNGNEHYQTIHREFSVASARFH